MTINRLKSKPEAQLQYGGRPFTETGSSFILAMDSDISSKFGKQMDIHLLKRLPLRNLNPGVNFRFYGRHLENRYDITTPPPVVGLLQNLAVGCKMTSR